MNQRVKDRILSHFDAALRRDIGLPPRKLILNLNWKFRSQPNSYCYCPERKFSTYLEYWEYDRYLFMIHSGIERTGEIIDITGDLVCQFRILPGSKVHDVMYKDSVTDDREFDWNALMFENQTFITAGFPDPMFENEKPLYRESAFAGLRE